MPNMLRTEACRKLMMAARISIGKNMREGSGYGLDDLDKEIALLRTTGSPEPVEEQACTAWTLLFLFNALNKLRKEAYGHAEPPDSRLKGDMALKFFAKQRCAMHEIGICFGLDDEAKRLRIMENMSTAEKDILDDQLMGIRRMLIFAMCYTHMLRDAAGTAMASWMTGYLKAQPEENLPALSQLARMRTGLFLPPASPVQSALEELTDRRAMRRAELPIPFAEKVRTIFGDATAEAMNRFMKPDEHEIMDQTCVTGLGRYKASNECHKQSEEHTGAALYAAAKNFMNSTGRNDPSYGRVLCFMKYDPITLLPFKPDRQKIINLEDGMAYLYYG